MPHHRRIALRTGERGTQKPIQVPPCLGSEIAAASDFVQSRHIRRQSFQNLLVRLVRSTKLHPAAQLKLSVGRLLVLARLLVINDPVINLRHRCHAPPHGFQYVGRAVFAHEEPYHRPPQNVQFHWIAGQPVRLLTLSQLQRSEEHTSELQSRFDLVCRLLLEKKKASSCACISAGAAPLSVPGRCRRCGVCASPPPTRGCVRSSTTSPSPRGVA